MSPDDAAPGGRHDVRPYEGEDGAPSSADQSATTVGAGLAPPASDIPPATAAVLASDTAPMSGTAPASNAPPVDAAVTRVQARRAIEALRAGVPNQDAVMAL